MKKIYLFCSLSLFLLIFGYLYVSFLLPLTLAPPPSSTIILDKNGAELGEIVYSGSVRHREITFEEIPEFYTSTLIHLEDRRFYTNNGIDLSGIVRSLVRNIAAGKTVE